MTMILLITMTVCFIAVLIMYVERNRQYRELLKIAKEYVDKRREYTQDVNDILSRAKAENKRLERLVSMYEQAKADLIAENRALKAKYKPKRDPVTGKFISRTPFKNKQSKS